jgi:hypothetical protein
MEAIRPDHPLRRLFAALVEDAFCAQVGMCDPSLTGYLADLLVSFTHIDRLNAIRNAQGKKLDHIAAMVALLGDRPPTSQVERDRTLYRHIGDYSLFWAGLYPEQLRRGSRNPGDILLHYVSQGKRCYAIVSELARQDDVPPPSLFRSLSEDFEYCLYGLGLVRREWERTRLDTSGELLV